ncbi:MAG: hypothetical protein WC783_05840 [Candidatus Paceibacterota bacterium]|jgi:hypothetical protein
MTADYNSKLIADLYECTDPKSAASIADEMVEMADPIFIYPIHAAYKKFKDTYYSHYFLLDLISFNTPEISEMITTVVKEPTVTERDLTTVLGYLSRIGFFEPEFIAKVNRLLGKELLSAEDYYDVAGYLEYLKNAKAILPIIETLKAVFEDEAIPKSVRALALKYLLREDPKTYLQYYYDNFTEIKNKKSEIIFTKEIIGWSGKIVSSLEEKILKEGSAHAKEIIETKRAKQAKVESKKEEDAQKAVEIRFTNADVIAEIGSLRKKINIFSGADSRFGYSFFPQSELIYQQTESAQTKQAFITYSIDIRSFIQEFTDNITGQEFTLEEMSAVIDGITKPEGSINKFHMILANASVTVDKDIFGLRNLNRIVNKTAHPDSESGLVELLKQEGLMEFYESESWDNLHKKMLEMYRDFLKKLHQALLTPKLPE